MASRNRKFVISAAVMATALAGFLWLRPDTIEVDVVRVLRGPLRVTVDDDGETRIRDRFVISAPVAGRLTRLSCKEGDPIDAGAAVAMLYPLPLDTRSREQAEARLRATDDAVGEARARWQEAVAAAAQAERDLARNDELARQQLLAPRTVEQARTLVRSTAAAVRALQLRIEAAVHERELAAAALRGTTATRDGILVRAPAHGKVLRLYEECERVITAGTPILEIGDPAQLEVIIDVLSDDALAIKPGAHVLVTSGPESDTLHGRVRLIEPAGFIKLSPLGVEEHRVNVIADLDTVPPGMGDRFRVDARIITWQAADVVHVPAGALFREGRDWTAFAVRGGRAVKVAVVAGRRGTTDVQILSGLAPGDVVITHPSQEITSGMRVRPRTAD